MRVVKVLVNVNEWEQFSADRSLRKPPRKSSYLRLVLASAAVFAGVFLLAWVADGAIQREDLATQEAVNCDAHNCYGVE